MCADNACLQRSVTLMVCLQPVKIRGFMKPRESLAKTLEKNRGSGGTPMKRPNYRNEPSTDVAAAAARVSGNSTFYESHDVDVQQARAATPPG